jgi:predicted nucleic acid-binding protein
VTTWPVIWTSYGASDDVFLRTSDCLHLVTALHHGFDAIHTHDRHQCLAAAALGLKAVTLP